MATEINDDYTGATVSGICPKDGTSYRRAVGDTRTCVPGECACGFNGTKQPTPDTTAKPADVTKDAA